MAGSKILPSITILCAILSVSMSENNIDDKFAASTGSFALDLFSKVSELQPNENLIFSPLSIQVCVALTHAGAAGPTADEIVQGLRLVSNDSQKIGQSFQNVMDAYKESTLLKIANSIYVLKDLEIEPNFKSIVTDKYYSQVENIDFSKQKEAVKIMNDWVDEKTNGKIRDIVEIDELDDSTRMMLLNAVYFKGAWINKFKVDSTRNADFWNSNGQAVKVHMMNLQKSFNYANLPELDAAALQLPYQSESGNKLAMMIILPNSKTGLTNLENKLKDVDLWSITQKLEMAKVSMKMPKFKIESTIKLTDALKKMGMKTMFSDRADFNQILVNAGPIKVDGFVHKAFVSVNEEGTEAAAVTKGRFPVSRIAMPLHDAIFDIDRPFLYIIIDTVKKIVPFFGKVVTLPSVE